MGAERHWTSRKYMMSNYFIIVPLLFIGLVNGFPITEDEYDADTWVPWLERPMIKVPNQGFLPNYQGDVNMQKRLMVPMPKMKLPDLSKLRLQDSFIGQERRGKRLMLPMGKMPDVGLNLSKFQISRNGQENNL